MTITIEYPHSGTVRIHRNLTQPQINKLLSNLSDLQDTVGEVHVRAKVEEEVGPRLVRAATVLDFHAGEVH